MAVSARASFASLAAVLLLAAGVTTATAQPQSAEEWLSWATDARQRHSFVGEFLYQHGDRIDTMRIWRSVNARSGVRERLLSLSGERREILRGEATVTCILPGSDSVMIDERQLRKPLAARLPDDIKALRPAYAVTLLGEDRVAGRSAMRLGIDARDGLRYSYELWLDQATGLLLRAELLSPVGEVLERLMMLDLELRDEIALAELDSQLPQEGYQRLTTQAFTASAKPDAPGKWQVDPLPEGFALQLDRMQSLPGRDHPVRHMMFSDGLATVSIYIEPEAQAEAIDGSLNMGAMNAYGKTIGAYQALAVGEVPRPTVERLVRALANVQSSHEADD